MALVQPTNLREWFDIVSDIKDARLAFCLQAASRMLLGWVGSTNYADSTLAETMKFAEAHLAVYHLLLNTGARIRRNGLVKQEQDAGGSVTNNVINEYYTTKELQALREEYLQAAADAVEKYRVVEGTVKAASFLMTGGWTTADCDYDF